MAIVVLDRETIGDDRINFGALENLAPTTLYANLSERDEILAAVAGARVLVLNKLNCDASLIAALPESVELISVTATGYDNVDLAAAKRRGIKVSNTPAYGTNAVAQMTLLLLLNCAAKLVEQQRTFSQFGWNKSLGLAIEMHELAGKTLGIIGLGAIGSRVAELANAFGMRVIAYTRHPKVIPSVREVSLAQLAQESDYVSLHCSLNPSSQQLVDAAFLATLKPSAYLINTARGGLLDEVALIAALKSGRLAGAALDVLTTEPPEVAHPLLNLDNVIVTPHIAWGPVETRQRCIDIAIDNVAAFLAGTPQNLLW